MKKNLIFLAVIALLTIVGCSSDDNSNSPKSNEIAFANSSINLIQADTAVKIVFLEPVSNSGTVTLQVSNTNTVYETDYTTLPQVENNQITVAFEAGVSQVEFTFHKVTSGIEGIEKNVAFTIASVSVSGVSISSDNKSVQVNFDEVPVVSSTLQPEVGGANVPNQVYVDFSSGATYPITRTKWDLGFYGGSDFRVAINGSIKMAAKKLDITDITQVVAIDETVAVGEGGGSGVVNGNIAYVDGPDGAIENTVIAVAQNDADNKVYLVNLGHSIPTEAPGTGSVNPYGNSRGWKKVRVLRDGSNYKLQYADVASATFEEITITKDQAFNFTFFSLTEKTTVTVEPEKTKWDINFTPFTNHTNFGGGLVSYAYQDFIVINTKGGTRAYEVLNSAGKLFADFTLADVSDAKLEHADAEDQRVIGANWRNGGGPGTLPSARDDRFYVVKDPNGNIYKVRFIAMTNVQGERGNPTFEYAILK